ncbi:MAG: CcmD family protein [Myxococcota bacterium]
MSYLIAAYAIVLLTLGSYALHLRRRAQRLRSELSSPEAR